LFSDRIIVKELFQASKNRTPIDHFDDKLGDGAKFGVFILYLSGTGYLY
jgi:hypothetical protein